MNVTVFSIFCDLIEHYASSAIIKRAGEIGALDLSCVDIRHFATDRHRSVDDMPYGGGAGMVMAPEPIFCAVEASAAPRPLYLLAPWGRRFDQSFAGELAALPGFSLLCGRYEGVDARVEDFCVDGAISLGDFVLAGGELAALAVIEATVRLLPNVLGNAQSLAEESFSGAGLEYPQYTRPQEFRGHVVPEILLSGHHGEIAKWRSEQAAQRTQLLRPDLTSDEG